MPVCTMREVPALSHYPSSTSAQATKALHQPATPFVYNENFVAKAETFME